MKPRKIYPELMLRWVFLWGFHRDFNFDIQNRATRRTFEALRFLVACGYKMTELEQVWYEAVEEATNTPVATVWRCYFIDLWSDENCQEDVPAISKRALRRFVNSLEKSVEEHISADGHPGQFQVPGLNGTKFTYMFDGNDSHPTARMNQAVEDTERELSLSLQWNETPLELPETRWDPIIEKLIEYDPFMASRVKNAQEADQVDVDQLEETLGGFNLGRNVAAEEAIQDAQMRDRDDPPKPMIKINSTIATMEREVKDAPLEKQLKLHAAFRPHRYVQVDSQGQFIRRMGNDDEESGDEDDAEGEDKIDEGGDKIDEEDEDADVEMPDAGEGSSGGMFRKGSG